MGGGLFRFVTIGLISPVLWYMPQMLPNVAAMFDRMTAEMVRARIL